MYYLDDAVKIPARCYEDDDVLHSDGSINLSTVSPTGTWTFRANVVEGAAGGTWCWPPRV